MIALSLVLLCLTIAFCVAFVCMFYNYKEQKEKYENLLSEVSRERNANRVIVLSDNWHHDKLTLPESDIYYIEAQDNYVRVVYRKEEGFESMMLRNSINNVEKMTEGGRLVRCHRSHIVNTDHIKNHIKGHNNSTVVIDCDEAVEIKVSKRYLVNLN